MNFRKRRSLTTTSLTSTIALVFSLVFLASCDTSVDDKIPEVTNDQIKIGLLAPVTGPLAGFAQDMEATARLAAQEINRAGGVNGKEIGFLVRDTRLGLDDSETVSVLMAQQLIDEGVVGIIGPAGSGTTIAITPTITASNIPIISPSATSPAISALDDNNLVWRSVASDAFQGIFLADQLVQEQVNSIGIIYRDDAYGDGLQQAVTQRFQQAGGQVMSAISYPADKSSEFDFEVNQLFVSGVPDAIVVISFIIDGANIMVSLANANLPTLPRLYGVDGNNRTEFIGNSPAQVILGMRGSSPTAPSTFENYINFSETYRALFNKPPPVFTESVYDAVYLIALAMSVGGENSALAIKNNLSSLSNADSANAVIVNVGPQGYATALQNLGADLNLEGAAGSIDFDENGDVTSGNYIFWEIVEQDGQLVFQTIRESSFP
ncbi:ABC transporter substrate-binding protein [Aliikangiella coralliicola]|uniref:ABC transporter substrate-binding protein n=1 Tax=Aliikangiella coralliicola TaxID=2592383 RepID=A0A545UD91_9GAMM|nr:ABC transporter substrate-binding protein [Aliikangiella coralliicola]TQV87403.1 ABC transporter substrate-binding protein [Aliikangiella coralliicola]